MRGVSHSLLKALDHQGMQGQALGTASEEANEIMACQWGSEYAKQSLTPELPPVNKMFPEALTDLA